jgi:hypothetical protein
MTVAGELVLTFRRERETKNTVRFEELVEGDGEQVVGTLYVQKQQLAHLGDPEQLRVTLTSA